MAEVAKKRAMRVWSMNTGKREPLFDGVKIEEKWQSALESPTGISLRRGIPVLAVCLFAGQGKLSGGAMPFAPALLAGAMMCGRSVGYAAAGCAVGALLAGSPGTALACALLLLLWVILRCLNLTPNDLTCVAAAGIASYALPALYAVTMQDQLTAAVGAVTAAVLARLYAAALRVKLNGRELLSPEEIISLSLLAAGVLTGFRSMEICGVSPVISALLLLNLGAGHLGGVGIGAAVGALTGLMLGVTQPVQPYLCVGLALSGLLPGLFSPLGRWGAAAALPVALVLAGAMDARFLTAQRAIEGAAAGLAFLLIRPQVWERMRRFVRREEQVRAGAVLSREDLRVEVRGKVQEYAALYGRMARTLAGAGGQYAAVSSALHAVANDLSVTVSEQEQKTREIAQALDLAHIRVESVQAQRVGEKQRVQICWQCRRRDGLCDKRMVRVVSCAAGVPLRIRPTGVCPREGSCRLTLEEACNFEVSAGFASRTPDGQPCGDTLTTVQLPEGQYMMALADGMGHGERAQAESRVAVDLIEDFLLARFEPEAALTGVNDLLLHKNPEESFTTMDLSLIDLTHGTLRAMKIGAADSYIRRGRRVLSVTGDALPMGILEKVRPSVTQMQLQDGDVLVMLSDGVADAMGGDEMWLTREILMMDVRSPESAARRLLADAAAAGHPQDDMTVGVLRIVQRGGHG